MGSFRKQDTQLGKALPRFAILLLCISELARELAFRLLELVPERSRALFHAPPVLDLVLALLERVLGAAARAVELSIRFAKTAFGSMEIALGSLEVTLGLPAQRAFFVEILFKLALCGARVGELPELVVLLVTQGLDLALNCANADLVVRRSDRAAFNSLEKRQALRSLKGSSTRVLFCRNMSAVDHLEELLGLLHMFLGLSGAFGTCLPCLPAQVRVAAGEHEKCRLQFLLRQANGRGHHDYSRKYQ